MKETNRRQRRMEASSEGGQSPKGAVAPQMECNVFMLQTWMRVASCGPLSRWL